MHKTYSLLGLPLRFVALFLLLIGCMGGGVAESAEPSAEGEVHAIRHPKTPCAYYLLEEGGEKSVRLTESLSPDELRVAMGELQANPTLLLSQFELSDLKGIVVGSVGVPLNQSEMEAEAQRMHRILDDADLNQIPVKIFPRPYTFLQRLRWELPIAADLVPATNAVEEEQARTAGLQITASANIPTWITLAFMGPSTGGAAWLLAIPPTAANLVLDYYLGKHRPSVNNFLARAGDSRLSAIFRDVQISFLFAIPFYLIPRFIEFASAHATGDVSLVERFLSLEFGASAATMGTAAYNIFISSLLQSLQIFTFMNPNAIVDKVLLNSGTPLTESQLRQQNTWRVAGFFALTAPIFAAANSPNSPVAFNLPLLEVPVSYPHLAMAVIATANYFVFYNHPLRLVEGPTSIYQTAGRFMSEVVSGWLVVRPMNALRSVLRRVRGQE